MDDNKVKDLKAGLKKFGKNDLDEVKMDARYNYLRRLREQQDKQEYEAAKAKGPEEVERLAQEAIAKFKGTAKKGK